MGQPNVVKFRKEHRALTLMTIIGFICLPAILFCLAVLVSRSVKAEGVIQASVRQSLAYRRRAQQIIVLLQDAEISQLNYSSTKDPREVGRFQQASADALGHLATLRSEISRSPRDLSDIDVMTWSSAAKIDELSRRIQAARQGRTEQTDPVQPSLGAIHLDAIRSMEAKIEADSRREVLDGNAQAALLQRTIASENLALTAVFFIAVAATGLLIWRSFRHRLKLYNHLKEVAARKAAVLDSAVDAIVHLTPSGTIESINAAGERMFGYTSEALASHDIRVLLELDLKNDGLFLSDLALAPANGKALIEGVGKDRLGKTFPVDIALGPMKLESGAHMVAIIRDISERRRIEAAKDQFVSSVSHELRTPLTSITGSLGLLNGGVVPGLPDAAKRLITIAHSNSNRLGQLVNDILDIERLQSEKMPFSTERFDLVAVFRKSAEDMEDYLRQHDVKLSFRIQDHPIWAMGDPARTAQVAANLISNAAKFSPHDGVVKINFAAKDRLVQASVSDSGPGIPVAFRAHIFKRFAQAYASDTRKLGSSGLGLAICKEIMERQGGEIFFKSELGLGSTFYINLPAAEALTPAAETVSPTAGKPARPKILICDDDLEMSDLLKALITSEGGEPELAYSLAQARLALAGGGFAGALMDLTLPDGDGMAFLHSLKLPADQPILPVIIVSARERQNLTSQAFGASILVRGRGTRTP